MTSLKSQAGGTSTCPILLSTGALAPGNFIAPFTARGSCSSRRACAARSHTAYKSHALSLQGVVRVLLFCARMKRCSTLVQNPVQPPKTSVLHPLVWPTTLSRSRLTGSVATTHLGSARSVTPDRRTAQPASPSRSRRTGSLPTSQHALTVLGNTHVPRFGKVLHHGGQLGLRGGLVTGPSSN